MMALPPNNANLGIHAIVGTKNVYAFGALQGPFPNSVFALKKKLPTNYSWHLVSDDDGKERRVIKTQILRGYNQRMCGDCFVFSTMKVLSDLFLIKNGYAYNPDLSVTYYLANNKMQQGICTGGLPPTVVQQIFDNGGTVSDRCVDYSPCDKNVKCNGSDPQNAGTMDELNAMFKDVGASCYLNAAEQHLSFLPAGNKDGAFLTIYPTYDKPFADSIAKQDYNKLQQNQNDIKTYIYRFGPVVGAIAILQNFVTPDPKYPGSTFTEFPEFMDVFDGIYFDSVCYDRDTSDMNKTTANGNNKKAAYYFKNPVDVTYDGGHAVTVIGWGVSSKPVPVMDFKTNKVTNQLVPYWWVRNSWGSDWALNGFIKVAMFPFNQLSQFDVPITITDGQVGMGVPDSADKNLGGMVLFGAGEVKKFPDLDSNNYYKENPTINNDKYNKDLTYYQSSVDLAVVVPGGVTYDENGNISDGMHTSARTWLKNVNGDEKKKTWIIVVVIVLCILALLGAWLYYRKYDKKSRRK